ncbi:MAG: hypothetical protein A2096_17885 [Spirochaetes bacterium GWF1_41_5]|nr:MAG: hypothetical protein A2096_17885 [Spirochaetes bacterium GWF1_41_5]HBE01654.1 hypothetical protein [Spirochaetia bacterium]
MKTRISILKLVFLLLSGNLIAGEMISYNEYTNTIKTQLTSVKVNQITLEKVSNTIIQTRGAGDTSLSAGAEMNNGKTEADSSSYITDSAAGTLFSLGAAKKILDTGTTISAGVSYQHNLIKAHSLNNKQTAFNYAASVPAVKLTISQSLLKNALGINDRAAVTDAKLAYLIQEIQNDLDNQNNLIPFSVLYYQLAGQIKTIEYLKTSLSKITVSEKQTKEQLEHGLIDNDDYQSTKNLYFQYQNSVFTFEHAYNSLRTKLQYYFQAAEINPDMNEWKLFLNRILTNNFEYISFENTKTAKILDLTEKRLKAAVKAAANSALPDLSLYGSLLLSGSSDSFISSFTNITSSPQYAAGIALNFPLENRTAKSLLKNKELELKSYNLQFAQTKQNYEIQLKNLIREISVKRSILQNTIERLQALKSMYKTQSERHEQGRINQITLNDTLIKIAAEEINLIDCEYSLIALSFDYEKITF